MASAAMAGDAELTCPAQGNAGESLMVNMSFENDECSAVNVRIMSSVVGNASDSLAGVGIFGPVVAIPVVVVPAGTNRFCVCNANQCECDWPGGLPLSCSTDADCPSCSASTPGTQNAYFDTQIDLPQSLSGTVATQIFISEFESGTEVETEVNECFVEVL
jgi:hypothetical protein